MRLIAATGVESRTCQLDTGHAACISSGTTNQERAMGKNPNPTPDEENAEAQQGLELPVNPDEGTPLIPDDEGLINVPT